MPAFLYCQSHLPRLDADPALPFQPPLLGEPCTAGQALAALSDAVLTLSRLAEKLVHAPLSPIATSALHAQLKIHADQATAASQQLRHLGFCLSAPAVQLSQSLTVLVLAASLLQHRPDGPLDPELAALLTHNAHRARHNLRRLLSLYLEDAGPGQALGGAALQPSRVPATL
jgi:hypothetical protein